MRLRFDPSLDPYGNLERKLSDSAGEETAHCVRRLLLHGGSHVGVGVQREPGAVMSQHGGEDFHVYAVMQGQNRERVPLWHTCAIFFMQNQPIIGDFSHIYLLRLVRYI